MHQLTLVFHCRFKRFYCTQGITEEQYVKILVFSVEKLEESFGKIRVIR